MHFISMYYFCKPISNFYGRARVQSCVVLCIACWISSRDITCKWCTCNLSVIIPIPYLDSFVVIQTLIHCFCYTDIRLCVYSVNKLTHLLRRDPIILDFFPMPFNSMAEWSRWFDYSPWNYTYIICRPVCTVLHFFVCLFVCVRMWWGLFAYIPGTFYLPTDNPFRSYRLTLYLIPSAREKCGL